VLRMSDHDVIGLAPFVRVAGGFLPLEPAIRPDSSLRFHRGVAPRTVPGESPPIVASAGVTPMAGPRSSRSCSRQGPAPALANVSPAAGCTGTGRGLLVPDVPGEGTTPIGAGGASVPAAPIRGEG